MDAFYAAVEQRDRPELRGRPVIVGGPPDSRAVVCTASYEARAFGVRSAMPASRAARLCPAGVFIPPDFRKYSEVSGQIRRIFLEATPLVEPLSLDEAYLDVTEAVPEGSSATAMARRILDRIREATRLSASAGVAPNKFLAKVASDFRKPGGLTVVPPGRIAQFLETLPVGKIPGVGPVTGQRLKEHGLRTCGDLRRLDPGELIRRFGRLGEWLAMMARGEDPRPVEPDHVRKSISIEDTLPRDESGMENAWKRILLLAEAFEERLRRAEVRGRTVVLKVKYSDFQQVTRSRTLEDPISTATAMLPHLRDLLRETRVDRSPFRLLGIGISNVVHGREEQLLLPFDTPPHEDP